MRPLVILRNAPLAAVLVLAACTGTTVPPPATATLRERVAALVLRQTDFGAISIILSVSRTAVSRAHSRMAAARSTACRAG